VKVLLLGHQIAYSASPEMHAAAFRAGGLDWTYEIADVPPQELPAAVNALRMPDIGGANVTIPHKVAAIQFLDALEGEAERTGAVNTIRRVGSRLIGSNTDVEGIREAARQIGIVQVDGLQAVVLGAGGAARAAAAALDGAEITFVARRPEAADLAGRTIPWAGRDWKALSRRADLLLNATPLGRGGELPLPVDDLPDGGAVIDLVYVRGGTPLVRAARLRGRPCADGWSVLLAQGAASFTAWTGKEPPMEAMREALAA
jgi:shikimate dehydrogenase